jgi:hypothetical protein
MIQSTGELIVAGGVLGSGIACVVVGVGVFVVWANATPNSDFRATRIAAVKRERLSVISLLSE